MSLSSFFKVSAVVGAMAVGTIGFGACSAKVTTFGECVVDGQSYEVGDTFSDDCNTCTCEAGGSVSCTDIACSDGCVFDGSFRDIGETFVAPDGCNTCTCIANDNVQCTTLGCGCEGPTPACDPPGPSCTSTAVCAAEGWECVDECKGCEGPPPPCQEPPPGCFYGEPECFEGVWSCGDLICDKPGCDEPPPPCPPPSEPGCITDLYCDDGFGWYCEETCPGVDCESQYPNGYQTLVFLLFQTCGCEHQAPCAAVCGDSQVCDGMGPTESCENCVAGEADNGSQCIVDAAFGPECTNDPQCGGYVQCATSQ